jgi:hypothetical protein
MYHAPTTQPASSAGRSPVKRCQLHGGAPRYDVASAGKHAMRSPDSSSIESSESKARSSVPKLRTELDRTRPDGLELACSRTTLNQVTST